MTTPDLIEDYFVTKIRAIPSLVDAIDHEPKALPRNLPVATMLFVGAPQETTATGEVTITWHWRVNLYIPLSDYKKAQQLMKELVPQMLSLTRNDPRLGDTCEWAEITDDEEDPIFAEEDAWLLKRFDLRCVTTES